MRPGIVIPFVSVFNTLEYLLTQQFQRPTFEFQVSKGDLY